MRPGRWIFVALLAAAGLAPAVPAAFAQGITGTRVGVNPYVGVVHLRRRRAPGDRPRSQCRSRCSEARLERRREPADWQFDFGYGYAQVETELSEFVDFPDPEDQIELDVHSLYGAADYFIGGSQDIPTRLLLSAGLGLMIVNPEVGDGDASFMIPLAVGFTHPVNDWITFRGEAAGPHPVLLRSRRGGRVRSLPGRRDAQPLRGVRRPRILGLAARSVIGWRSMNRPRTIPELFLQAVERHDRPDFMRYKAGGDWAHIPAREFREEVELAAHGLIALGIQPGDRVALLSENRPGWALADLATLSAGAWLVPIYTSLTADEVQYILEDSGARDRAWSRPQRSSRRSWRSGTAAPRCRA